MRVATDHDQRQGTLEWSLDGPLDVDGLADGWVVRRELAKVVGWSDAGPHPANAHAARACVALMS